MIPTPKPKRMIRGQSISRVSALPGSLDVQAALVLLGAGPAPLAPVPGLRAVRAADRRVAAIVQRVVGDVVREDVAPDVLLGPVDERAQLPEAVRLVPGEL